MGGKTPILACITLGLTLSATFVPPPQITVKDPRILYSMALYKSAIGDTASALRLVQRAEQSKLRRRAASEPRAEILSEAKDLSFSAATSTEIPAFEGAQ